MEMLEIYLIVLIIYISFMIWGLIYFFMTILDLDSAKEILMKKIVFKVENYFMIGAATLFVCGCCCGLLGGGNGRAHAAAEPARL